MTSIPARTKAGSGRGEGVHRSGGRTVHKSVGRYALLERVGRGGMGEVWAAYDERFDRRVAVKLVSDVILEHPHRAVLLRRFERECRAAARIEHPGLVPVYDTGAVGEEAFYLVMQLVEGRDLSGLAPAWHPAPWQTAVAVGAQLAAALAAVHAAPVVHRDVKPQNVMVRTDGTVVLLDLGIASLVNDEGTKLTRRGEPLGTPAYMAPEQSREGAATPACDLYALGCVLYELLAGAPPFTGETRMEILIRHWQEEPAPLHAHRQDLPEALTALVHELLAKDPGLRPGDAREVYRRLLPLLPPVCTDGAAALAPHPACDPTRPFRFPFAPAVEDAPAAAPAAAGATQHRLPTVVDPHGDALLDARHQAQQLVGQGLPARAADVLDRAVPLAVRQRGGQDPGVAVARRQHAQVLILAGRYEDALAVLDLVLPHLAADEGADSRKTLDYWFRKASCLEQLGRLDQARPLYEWLADAYARSVGLDPVDLYGLRQRIGRIQLTLGETASARQTLRALLGEMTSALGPYHQDVIGVRTLLERTR
ncbi:protein kinase [Streptomyces sp. NPDC050418]|uniref:serine/threonine-protein kinase n=1 Tax=Streptomyces sp. NPDC050418 TaxID=3365612 RepID=UPI00379D9149